MTWRVSKNAERFNDPGWAMLLIAGSAWLAARFLRPWIALLPSCIFQGWTGWPCPTCGSTRAGLALADGEIFAAFSLQPLFVSACFVAGGFALHAIVATLTGKRLQIDLSPREHLLLRAALIAAILLNWIYLGHAGL